MSRENIDTIEDVNNFYMLTKQWLQNLANAVNELTKQGIVSNPLIPTDLLFLAPYEIDASLNNKLDHLSAAASLQLFTAFEGSLRFDTTKRQRKARVGKDLKNIIRRKNLKDISVIDIINCWCNRYSIDKRTFSVMKGLFRYRHWLAHGRYWDNIGVPVSKSAITPEYIYSIMRDCFDEFNCHEPDFIW